MVREFADREGCGVADANRPLSQAEIDALLDALSNDVENESPAEADTASLEPAASPETRPASPPSEVSETPDARRAAAVSDPRLQRTLGLPVTVSVTLGSKGLPIKSLLNWGIGTQIVLNREWHHAVPVKVNGLELGEARVVLVNNNFGVEITRWGRAK